MTWTMQQYSMENPMVLAYEDKPLLVVELDGKDDAIHTKSYKILAQIVDELNKNNITIDLSVLKDKP
jgi:hypothetical protein